MAKEVTLYDNLKTPDGGVISEQSWYIGEMLPGEEVIVEYTIYLSQNAYEGLWENQAWAEGVDLGGQEINSGKGSSVFTLVKGPIVAGAAVLGASTSGEIKGAKTLPQTGPSKNRWGLVIAALLLIGASKSLNYSAYCFCPQKRRY